MGRLPQRNQAPLADGDLRSRPAYADSLKLTQEQVARVAVLRDSLAAQNDSLAAELQSQIEEVGADADPRTLISLIRFKMQRARENVCRNVDAVRAVLSEEQWEMAPEGLREAGERRVCARLDGE